MPASVHYPEQMFQEDDSMLTTRLLTNPSGRRASLCTAVCMAALAIASAARAQPAPRLTTRWTTQVRSDRTLPEYPRPQLVRSAWQNLNGRWDYAIRDRVAPAPDTFDGRILVPFAPESYLSGVQKAVGDTQRLWYRKNFTTPARTNARAGDR